MVTMRTISLNQKSLNYLAGNVLANAITFCGHDEILVGLSNGQLLLFRSYPSFEVVCDFQCNDLVTAVASSPSMSLDLGFDYISVTALGLLTFFRKTVNALGKEVLQDVCSIQTPPNSFNLIIGDVEENGQLEIIIGYTDRFARIYKTKLSQNTSNSLIVSGLNLCGSVSFTGHVASMCAFYSYSYNANCLLVSQPGATFVALSFSELPKNGGLFAVDDKIRRGPGKNSLLCRTSVKTSWCRPFSQFSQDRRTDTVELVCITTLDGLLAICRFDDGAPLFEIALCAQIVNVSSINVKVEQCIKCFIAVASWNGIVYLVSENSEICKLETGVTPQCVAKPDLSSASDSLCMVSLAPTSLITFELNEFHNFINPRLFSRFETDDEFFELLKKTSPGKVHDAEFLRELLYKYSPT